MSLVEKALDNMRRFEELNPTIVEAIKEGYQVAAYDEDTRTVITKEIDGDSLKIHIVEDGYFIPKEGLPNTITALVQAVHKNAIDKGWYEEPRSFGEDIALMHSELSEALEDHRKWRGFNEIYFEGDKPCGIPTELADTVIRIFDTCGHLGIDLEAAIAQKMAYNATRPQRHGGKKL